MSDLRLRARSVTEIVDAAFQLYRRDALEYILVTAVAYSPILIAQLMLFGAVGMADPSVLVGTMGGLWVVLIVLGVVGYAVMMAVVNKYSSDVYLGHRPDLAEIIRSAVSKILPLIGAALLFGVLVMIGVIPFAVAVAAAGVAIGSLGFLLTIAWALYAAARFFSVFQIIVLENRGVLEAFGRAGVLSRGRKGHILLTLCLVILIVTVAAFAVMAIATLSSSQMAAGVVQMIYTIVAYPLLGIAQMILYYDLRIRAEGFDIEVMTGALGAGSPTPPPRGVTS